MALKLTVSGTDWTDRVKWSSLDLSMKEGLGVTCSFEIDVTGTTGTAPTGASTFTLEVPSGEKFVLKPVTEPSVPTYGIGSDNPVVVYKYECIDFLSALDRKKLPAQEYIDSNSGEILQGVIAALDATINVTNIVTGNSVPYLNTDEFVKLSDIIKQAEVSEGAYIVQILPTVNNGLAVKGDYKSNFGATGISVDKDTEDDFTPPKDPVVPESQIINCIRVKGNPSGGPDHTVCEFRELDALVPSFKLKSVPYGLDFAELFNFQISGGSVTGQDTSGLPKVIPIQYPVVVEASDVAQTGTGELFGLIGRAGAVLLSMIVNSGSIGAKVSGTSFTQATPFFPNGAAPDVNHQYYYDFYAAFTKTGLEVRITENYLDNTAGSTVLATVAGIADNVITLTLPSGVTVGDLPKSIRFFENGVPGNVRGFATIISRSGSTITIDPIPTGLIVGDKLANADSAMSYVTEKVIYNSTAPSTKYAKPQLIVSGGSGITAGAWSASYGPAIEMTLLDNPYDGKIGRRLKVDAVQSKMADVVVTKSGNNAVATFVGDRLPLRGDIRLLINYDAAKQADVVVQDTASQAIYGVRQGEPIESEFAITVAEATALGQAVLDEFASVKPKGTIKRESYFVSALPMPAQTVAIDLPTVYNIAITTAPISDVHITFVGAYFDNATQTTIGVLNYEITFGSPDLVELVERDLFAKENPTGIRYRELMASGPRITGATWNDVDTVVLTISGGGTITLSGKAATATFNPASYFIGNLREAPVTIQGSIVQGGITHELQVEVIYPPLDINVASSECIYSPQTNLVTFSWGRPAGKISSKIQRLLDHDENPATALVWRNVDEILNEQYPLPYELNSRKIKVLSIGLADKTNPAGYQELECVLPQIPVPSTFSVVKSNHRGKFVFLVSAPPAANFKGRAEFLRIFMRRSNTSTTYSLRTDFPSTNDDVLIRDFPINEKETGSRYRIIYDDYEPGERAWTSAVWVDRFHDEGAFFTPFDAAHPPVSVGSISLGTFFQTASQASGGTVEDDNDATGQVDYTGKFRVNLGRHNDHIRLDFDESDPTSDGSISNVWDNDIISSKKIDISDQNVLDGFVDVVMKQDFRATRKKIRTYRPMNVTFIGPHSRSVNDGGGNANEIRERRHLVGYDPDVESAPALVAHKIDAVFDKKTFEFQPGKTITHNFTTIAAPTIAQKQDGIKIRFTRPDDTGIRRFFLLIHTAVFGTKGPGTDANIATDLDAIVGEGNLLVYESTNTTRNVTVKAVDIGDVQVFRIHNGDTYSGLTITSGTTYFVSILAQKKSGRWSTAFSTVVNTSSGAPAGGGSDTDEAAWTDGATQLTDPNTGSGQTFINLRVKVNRSHQKIKFNVPQGVKGALTTKPISIIKYGIKIKAGSSNNWLNPDAPGTPITSDAGDAAEFFVSDNSVNLNINRAEYNSVFKTQGLVAAIRPYNVVAGVEKKGTITSYLSTPVAIDPDNMPQNTSAPGAVNSLSLTWSNRKGYKSTWKRPTSNFESIIHYRVVYFNGVNYMNPHTGALINTGFPSTDETTASIFVPDTHHTTHLKRSELAATFQTSGVNVKVIAVNLIDGVETEGTPTTSSIVLPTDPDTQTMDSSASGAIQNLALVWSVKKGYKATWDRPATVPNALRGYKVVFMNTAGNRFMIPTSGSSTTVESTGTVLVETTHYTTNLKKSDIHSDFSGGVKVKVTPVSLVNGTETDGTSTTSSVISLGNEVINARDAADIIDVFSLMIGTGNACSNGDFLISRSGTPTELGSWRKRSSPFTSENVITTATTDLVWNQTDHGIEWKSNSVRLYNPFKKRFIPGEYFAVSFMAKMVGSVASPAVTVRFRGNSNEDWTETALSITLTSLSGSYAMYGGVIRLSTGATANANKFLSFETSVTLDSANYIVIDKIMVVRGQQPQAYTPRPLYEQGPGSTVSGLDEDFDTSPGNTGTPDIGTPSGSQGGWFDSGGGRFDPAAL